MFRRADVPAGLGRPYYVFLLAQSVSNLGSAVSLVLVPLIVLRLTGSPLSLGIAMAVEFLPYPLFGLVIGAYVDRLSRRQVMIAADAGRMLAVASIPVLAHAGMLDVWWIYLAGFTISTLTIAFNAAEFAVMPALVGPDRLDAANGRLSAAYSAVGVLGPALAGVSLMVMSASTALLLDAGSFAFSACCLRSLRRSLPERVAAAGREPVRHSIAGGVRFVFGHPVLRACAILLALTNLLVGATAEKQIVTLAKQHYLATDSAVSWLFVAAGLGTTIFSLLSARLARRLSAAQAILIPFFGGAVCMFCIGVAESFPSVVVLWALGSGLGMFFVVNLRTLRQRLAPPRMLARVVTVSQVLSWTPVPLGAVLGGWVTARAGSAAPVFAGLGVIQLAIAAAFLLGPLRRADAYLNVPAGSGV
ncbi:MFS transporter [Sphaerisporangium perillae]|uniref:MFS transporter n=1 Tax=Sphaerisporangium perillae TaxID=2935860 RepID=UPI00200D9524|nr:MFS transporter [Sphaerisporangium perillae]